MAREALGTGQPALARDLAEGLLQADSRSGFAHYVIAVAEDQMERPADARRAAIRAYRLAEHPTQRFEAAQLAAKMFYKEESPTQAQLWLRRSIQHAPNDQVEAQLVRDYKAVRAQNPLSFSVQAGIRPSNNVNNGADTGLQVIDGLPYVGSLSGNAQALSGVIGHVDGTLDYRLQSDKTSRTTIGARLYVKRVALDRDAKVLSPGSHNRDFASTYGAVNLSHTVVWGPRKDILSVEAVGGQYWSKGARDYDFGRLGARQVWRLGGSDWLALSTSLEARNAAASNILDTQILTIGLSSRHRLQNDDALSFGLTVQKATGDLDNNKSEGVALSATYSFGEQLGPIKVAAGVTASHADYPEYTAVFAVPGGRQDMSVSAHLNLMFAGIDYAGFAPTLRLSSSRTKSNVSRFDTRELSVAMGIQSKF